MVGVALADAKEPDPARSHSYSTICPPGSRSYDSLPSKVMTSPILAA